MALVYINILTVVSSTLSFPDRGEARVGEEQGIAMPGINFPVTNRLVSYLN